jgi:hypothetical protein
MKKIFQSVGGGKTGASLAVIVAHAAPFMGAQTTNTQRTFLPHPMDTIISQPFGMSEDLISMSLAEAATDPNMGSISLTMLIVLLNLSQYMIFEKFKDLPAGASALANAIVGIYVCQTALLNATGKHAFMIVGAQLMVQLFVVPLCASVLCRSRKARQRQMRKTRTFAIPTHCSVHIVSKKSNRCLYAEQHHTSSTGLGANWVDPEEGLREDCIWKITDNGDGGYEIVNEYSKRVLYARRLRMFGGTLGEDDIGARQNETRDIVWDITQDGDAFKIVNQSSGRILFAQSDQEGDMGFGAASNVLASNFELNPVWYIKRAHSGLSCGRCEHALTECSKGLHRICEGAVPRKLRET